MADKQKTYPHFSIQMLEPRIMFDGAAVYAASEAIEAVEDQIQNDSLSESDLSTNLKAITHNNDLRKEIVFIDKGVDDYQTIINSIDDTKSIYLIDSNENGFAKMQSILQDQSDIDAVHIIGHASTGQVVLGNSILNSETINSFSTTLQSIGTSLTQDGDLLFYGCNLAQGEQGKLLIQQIGNITQADIAASDDITGKGGDWDLEKKYGIVETNGISVVDYKHSLLQNGISSLDGFVENTGTNLRAGTNDGGHAASASNHTDGHSPYVITLERENINSGSFVFYKTTNSGQGYEENNSGVQTRGPDITSGTTTVDASSTPMNSYYVYATENSGRNTVRSVTFENEILGVWFNMNNIIAYSGVDKSGGNYHTISQHGSGGQNAFSTEKLKWEWSESVSDTSKPSGHKHDWFGVDTDSNKLYIGFNNGAEHGDIVRVFTKASNQAPVAVDDTDSVNEDATVTKTGSENDVLNDDSDPDGDTITVSKINHNGGTNSNVSSSSTSSSGGTSVTGTYGTLTIGGDGSYTYVADQDLTDDLDAGDPATDIFVYTITDGGLTDTANLTISITGVNDAPVAVDDADSVTAAQSVSKSASQDDVMNNDSDPDDDDSFTVTHIKKAGGSDSTVSSGTTNSNGTSVTGTYGVLTIGADGSYTYNANNAVGLALNQTAIDTFEYTITDTQGGTALADLVITITGINNSPSAQNDVGVIDEGETLTVANGASANVSGSFDADEEHSGDLIDTSSSSHKDSDPDGDTLSITLIKETTAGSNSSITSNSTYNGTGSSAGTSVSGLYGTLTIGSDGSYKYVANDSISGFDSSETLEDSFTYTLSDGSATDTGTLTITLLGQDNENPSATDNTNAVNEDATVTVTDGTTGVTGDVLINDTDPEGDTLTVSKIKKNEGSFSNVSSGTTNSNGTSVTGSYGTLVIGADGSYTYTADQDLADALDGGSPADTITDIFVYEVSDGNSGSDTANITITITGINDPVVATDDTDSVNEDASVTKTGAQDDVLDDDTDADASASLSVSKIKHSTDSSYSSVTSSSTHLSNFTTVTGTYGTLKIGADGSYIYTADQTAADAIDASDTKTDVFDYEATDGTLTATATLTITVTGVNDTPVAQNDTGTINEDGTLTVINSSNNTTVTPASLDTGSPYSMSEGAVRSLAFNHDGTKMFVLHHNSGSPQISVHALTTAFDINTATQSSTSDVYSHNIGNPRGLRFNNDGTKLYISNGTGSNKKIYEFALSTAYDVSSLPTPTSTVISGQDGGPRGFTFNNDGTKMFLLGDNNDAAYEYSLSTAFDTTTISYTSRSLDFSAKEATPRGISFNATGKKLFITGQQGDDEILEYDLSTGFDLSTATFNGAFDVSSYADNSTDIIFNNDGTKAFLARATNNGIQSFSLSSPYSFVDITGEYTGDVIDTTSSSNKDSDADASASLRVSAIQHSSAGSSSAVSNNTTYGASGTTTGTTVTGTYGQLTIGSDGSYKYVANDSDADALDAGDIVTDVFTYTLTDGTATDTATITITVIGINDTPTAQDDEGAITEDLTLTVTNGSNSTISGSLDTTGENSGDVLDTSSSSHKDSDLDTSASLSVKLIRKNLGTDSSVQPGSSYNSSGTSVTGTYGTITIGADGSYSYAADQAAADSIAAGESQNDVFVYTITDGTQDTTANITIKVLGANDNPSAQNDVGVVNEGSTLTVQNSANANVDGSFDANGEHSGDVIHTTSSSHKDSDLDTSDTLSITLIKKKVGGSNTSVSSGSSYNSSGTDVTGSYGTLTIGADGSYKYVASSDISGLNDGATVSDTFTYTLSDGTTTTTADLVLTVIGGAASNQSPVAVNDTDSVNENASVTKTGAQNDVLNDDSDPDGDTIRVDQIQHSTAASGTSVSNNTTYGASGTTTGTTVTGTYGQLTIGSDGSYVYSANQSAAEALATDVQRNDVFTYRITDGSATATATLTITVTGVNDAPVAVDDTDSVNENETVTKTGSQNDVLNDDTDADTGASLSVSNISHTNGNSGSVSSSSTYNSSGTQIIGTYGTLTIGADGSYSYTADQTAADALDVGESKNDVFTYTLTDGTATDTATLTIAVSGKNDTPVGVDDTDSVNEDATVTKTGSEEDVLNDDTDADTDASLTVTNISHTNGNSGTVSSGSTYSSSGTQIVGTYGTLTIGADGSYTYTADQTAADDLDADDPASDVFTYTLTDENSATATATLTINITGVNDTPVAVNDTDSVNEDATVSKTASQDDVLNDDTDADDSASLTVSAIRTGAEDGTGNSGTVGSALTGTYGTLTLNSNGSYTYVADQSAADDLDAGDTANDIFTYTVSDGTATDTATLIITVTGVNDTPVAVDDTDSVDEDSSVTKLATQDDVLDDDTDADDDDPANLTVTKIQPDSGSESNVSSGTTHLSGTSVTGTYGTLVIGSNGAYKYTADQAKADALDAGDTETDVFTYTVSDGTATDTATLTITVTGINDDPVGVDDTDSVNEDETVTKTAAQNDLLNDDTDADVDDSSSLTVTNISHSNGNSGTVASSSTYESNGTQIVGEYGTLTVGADGSYTYTADQDAADNIADGSSEIDVFTYTVSDGNGGTDTATITITVTGQDNEVVGNNDTGSVTDGNTLSVGNKASGLLSNDTNAGTDADETADAVVSSVRTGREAGTGTSGTVGSSLKGTYGTLTLNSDGTYSYVADQDGADILTPDTTAIDYFTYTISNGSSTDTAQLAVTVTGINDAPTSSTAPTFRGAENNRIVIQSKLFFDDPDPSTSTYGQLTYSYGGLPSGLTVNDAGRIRGRLPEGTYTFTVTATDGGNLSTQQTFTIIIGKPGKPGEAPTPPLIVKQKTLEAAIADKTVTFETPKVNDQIADLAVRGNLGSLVKEYTFNGGMKVIDVAVEDLNIDQSGRPGINENTLLGFAIGDDYRLNVKQYTGTLEDGSSLPSWIRVDPSTGQTIVQFPQNIYSIDVKVIAIDNDNSTREINVTLDRNSVSQDKALKRDLEPFIDRSAALKTEVTVDEKGQILLDTQNDLEDGSVLNDTLNPNDSNNNDNQTPNTDDQSNLIDIPTFPGEIDDVTSQEAIVLNTQNFETDEKLIKFATLQEQLDLQYEGHENYGDKLVKVSG